MNEAVRQPRPRAGPAPNLRPRNQHLNEFDPTTHPDPAVSKATWVIGVAAALVLGMAIGVVMTEAAAPSAGAPCAPWPQPARTVEVSTGQ